MYNVQYIQGYSVSWSLFHLPTILTSDGKLSDFEEKWSQGSITFLAAKDLLMLSPENKEGRERLVFEESKVRMMKFHSNLKIRL